VEDEHQHLVGLVTYRDVISYLSEHGEAGSGRDALAVRHIMQRNPLTIPPETTTRDAIRLMRANEIAMLPVVRDEKLVGVVTERDLLRAAGHHGPHPHPLPSAPDSGKKVTGP
jgi:CBS domain-containing protein